MVLMHGLLLSARLPRHRTVPVHFRHAGVHHAVTGTGFFSQIVLSFELYQQMPLLAVHALGGDWPTGKPHIGPAMHLLPRHINQMGLVIAAGDHHITVPCPRGIVIGHVGWKSTGESGSATGEGQQAARQSCRDATGSPSS